MVYSTCDIGRALKRFRLQQNVSVRDLALWLSDNGSVRVTERTVRRWESGEILPSLPTFMLLCARYQIQDPPRMLQEEGAADIKRFPISDEEKNRIDLFRSRPEMCEAIKRLLRHYALR